MTEHSTLISSVTSVWVCYRRLPGSGLRALVELRRHRRASTDAAAAQAMAKAATEMSRPKAVTAHPRPTTGIALPKSGAMGEQRVVFVE